MSSNNTEIELLRAFAREIMECWPGGEADGAIIEQAAIRAGLLTPETRHEPCGECCFCAEACTEREFAEGVICYRATPLLLGQPCQPLDNQLAQSFIRRLLA